MSSPVIWGPNNVSIGLQNSEIAANGNTFTYEGTKNYVTGGGFENGLVNGWAAIGLATLTNGLPTTVGSGGTALTSSNGGRAAGGTTTAPAVISSGQLSGLYSLNLATSGAGTIGDGYISPAYTIDLADQAKMLTVTFNYKVITGTPNLSGTSSNTYAVAVYDMVNNAWLAMAGNFNLVQSTGVGQFVGTVQTASNSTGLQIFIYSPVAPAAASSLYIDNMFMGPQTVQKGPAISDWVAYTPTFTGFGIVTGINIYSRRVGDSLQIKGYFTAGTTTAVTALMTYGYNGVNANVTLDTTKIGIGYLVGQAGQSSFSSTTYFGMSTLSQTTGLNFGQQTSTAVELTAGLGTMVVSSASVSIYAEVPIVGWSSNTVMSSDTDTRVVAMRATGSGITISATQTALTGFTTVKDTNGAFNGTTLTAPVTGWYDVFAQLQSGYSSASALNLSVAVAGSIVLSNYTSASVPYPMIQVMGTIFATAGQAITFPGQSSVATTALADATRTFVTVALRSGPAVVSATESVNASYTTASAQSFASGTTAAIVWNTKVFDSHNGMNTSTGVYTVPVSGKYRVSGFALWNQTSWPAQISSNNIQLGLQKNASYVYSLSERRPFTSEGYPSMGGTATLNFNAGDTISLTGLQNSGATQTLLSSSNEVYMSLERIGN